MRQNGLSLKKMNDLSRQLNLSLEEDNNEADDEAGDPFPETAGDGPAFAVPPRQLFGAENAGMLNKCYMKC